MKVNKLNKKLVLSKATISNLNPIRMEAVNGGGRTDGDTFCPTECGGICVDTITCPNTLSECTLCIGCN